jgi:chromosome partitioning protein
MVKFDKPITISLFNNKGGVGKTQIALNLASVLSDDYKVLLVDNDRQANATGILYGEFVEEQNIQSLYQEGPYKVLEVYGDRESISVPSINSEAIIPSYFKKFFNEIIKKHEGITRVPNKELYLLPGCPVLEEIRSVLDGKIEREKILKKHLAEIKNNFDFIIIDNPPSTDVFCYNGLYASDFVIIPFKPGAPEYQGLDNLRRIITSMQKAGVHIDILGVVVNMYNERTKAAKHYVSKIYDIFDEAKIFDVVIPLTTDYVNAYMDNLPIDLHSESKASSKEAFTVLKDEVLGKLAVILDIKKSKKGE